MSAIIYACGQAASQAAYLPPPLNSIGATPRQRVHTFKETAMPLVRIDLAEGQSAEYRSAVADEVYKAMTTAMNVPADDRFMVVSEHKPGDFVADPGYLGIQRSPQCGFVQLTLNMGRDVDTKRAFYQALADGLHARVGLRREDVFISLVEVSKENWSFGNGEAQYAK
jgi:phenylpyruvate tautomerase PptA (4-oxalocrotonate tautomerase family)